MGIMIDRIPKGPVIITLAILGALVLSCMAYARPGFFTSETYLGGLLLLEVMLAAVWHFRKLFFVLLIGTFLMAGLDAPVGGGWTMARWAILGLGALVGSSIMLKDRGYKFGLFHVVATFAVLAALVSAAVSRYTMVSSLKVLSLLLLFIYAATGARLAVLGRENRFFDGLLTGCEIVVGLLAVFTFMGKEILGNPNSRGAVMGVACAPLLLWGALVSEESFTKRRRIVVFAVAMLLAFESHARAGMLAAFVSCALLCLALRRYGLFGAGIGILAVIAASSAIVSPEVFSRSVDQITDTVVFKGKDPSQGLLLSRKSPWQDTVDSIRQHFWFGTGFGTSDTGQDATEEVGKFSSSSLTSVEHGSSFLAITAWVGILGVLPFAFLVGMLLAKVGKTVWWMWKTGNPMHPAVPLAMVMIAGMTHAMFEDWMFAPGYYVCVFFWSLAFVFIDQTALLTVPDTRDVFWWRARAMRQELNAVASTR